MVEAGLASILRWECVCGFNDGDCFRSSTHVFLANTNTKKVPFLTVVYFRDLLETVTLKQITWQLFMTLV